MNTLLKLSAFASTALMSSISISADDTILAVTPGIDPQTALQIAGKSFNALKPGDSLNIIDARTGRMVATLNVPNENRYRLAKYRDEYFAPQKRAIRAFVVQPADQVHTNTPNVLAAIGKIRDLKPAPVQAVIVGNGLYLDDNDPAISMLDSSGNIQIPSDGFLIGSSLLSVYGHSDNQQTLSNVKVHFCANLPDDTLPFEKSRVTRFWAHYVKLRGGDLVTFEDDIALCMQRFEARLDKAIEVSPLNPDALPGMIHARSEGAVAHLSINERGDLSESLELDTLYDQKRIDALEEELAAEQKRLAEISEQNRELSSELAEARTRLKGMDKLIAESKRLGELTTFSRFQYVKHPTISGTQVITGIEYELESFPAYTKAWCYISTPSYSSTSTHISIGDKNAGEDIVWAKSNRPENEIKAIRAACRFPEDAP